MCYRPSEAGSMWDSVVSCDWTHAKLLTEKLSGIHLHNRSHRCHHFVHGYSYRASFASWCPEDYRQKLGLCETLLSLGDWTHAKLLMEKLSWIHLHTRSHHCHHFLPGYLYCASFASWCPEDYRQKLGLWEALLSLGDWTHTKLLMEKLSWSHLHNRSHRCHLFSIRLWYCANCDWWFFLMSNVLWTIRSWI